jgi:hypothetical protein
MTTTFDIERRLRLPAPDEPAVLPPLVFSDSGAADLVRPTVRFRVPLAQPQGVRLVYAAVAFLLLLAAVVAVGALRLLEDRNRLADQCGGPDGPAAVDAGCWTVEVPEGWQELSSASLFPGDFTEVASGIAYERVDRVFATGDLGDCPGPGPLPTGIPIASNVIEIPRETADVGLLCWRTAALPANAIRVEILRGSRVSGLEGADGPAIPDTSEPTLEAGWTEQVGDRPARLVITPGSGEAGAPAETRTWDILRPGSIDQIIRVRAEIAGPDLGAGRTAIQKVIDSFEFATSTPPIDARDRARVLRTTLDGLDQGARQAHSDLYSCFPREPGERSATISGGFAGPLGGPVEVRCKSSISPSRAELWRISLELSWEARDAYPADALVTEHFALGSGGIQGGGYVTARSGRRDPTGFIDALMPGGGQELPPLLTGPLDIPPGSVAQILAPGIPPAVGPDEGGDTIAPSIVGLHLYVVGGPEVRDGEEWYRVQWDGSNAFSGDPNAPVWAQGTKDGRPLLAVVQPACPTEQPTVADLTWLIAAERLICFGNRDLTIELAVIEPGDPSPRPPDLCASGAGEAKPCPSSPGTPAWLTRPTTWTLYGEGGHAGPAPGMAVWIAPAADPPTSGVAVRVVGHFDDPAAGGCTFGDVGASGIDAPAPEFAEILCRERFVITGVEPAQ